MTDSTPGLLHEYLRMSADNAPDKVAVVCSGERLTYREIDEKSERFASFLVGAGVRPDDRVALLLDTSVEAIVCLFGILKAGAIFLMLSPSLKAGKLCYILNDCQARTLVADTSKSAVVLKALPLCSSLQEVIWTGHTDTAAALPGRQPVKSYRFSESLSCEASGLLNRPGSRREEALATIIYTSGSTGEPKGVMCPHQAMISAARSIIHYLENSKEDVVLNALPLSFDYGLYQVLMTFMFGGTVVLEQSFIYLHRVLQRIEQERVTGFPVVPTMVAMLLRMRSLAGYDFSSLRYMTNTAAALPVEHIRKLRTIFPQVKFFSMYGLTECKRVSYLPPAELDLRPTSVGKPMKDCRVFVVDDQGRELGPGQVGELVVQGPNVMSGYWNDPDLTARTFRTDRRTGSTLLYTGDLFSRDSDGYLYFVARKDDLIKTRGERVSPREVENVLCGMEGVMEAAVVGV
ncbi:MAG: AMP-binding protein, partial [Deltaproteobacteria bacterium]|nr:AMP-binding protein [Deltaproteobacteria bacterium]